MNTDARPPFSGLRLVERLLILSVVMTAGCALGLWLLVSAARRPAVPQSLPLAAAGPAFWTPPSLESVSDPALQAQLRYGRDLIVQTAAYLGPQGSVMRTSNGMNCQNCHLDAGTRVFGNNYGSVAAQYPKYRARSGTIEDLNKRINDCMERSLNGRALDTLGPELKAIKAYIAFIGSNVPKGAKAEGSGLKALAYLDRAADPEAGAGLYVEKCQVCHQADGSGQLAADGKTYVYPPLWGPHSYNDGAGLYRLGNFARYIKYNMPLGATHDSPILSDAEAWDIAAYVNTRPRPHKATPHDWPDVAQKPVDHPFGPYADAFSEQQHKLGPFKPIVEAQQQRTAVQASSASIQAK
ncbi:MAG: c-type cytochrome [Bacteroidia bacterium]|nr:c-type cytochrome [Bacteroidia bacterium]